MFRPNLRLCLRCTVPYETSLQHRVRSSGSVLTVPCCGLSLQGEAGAAGAGMGIALRAFKRGTSLVLTELIKASSMESIWVFHSPKKHCCKGVLGLCFGNNVSLLYTQTCSSRCCCRSCRQWVRNVCLGLHMSLQCLGAQGLSWTLLFIPPHLLAAKTFAWGDCKWQA